MKIDSDLIPNLQAIETNGNRAVIRERLDRGLYTRVNKVLELLGGKWNKSAKAHLFNGDAGAIILAAINEGQVTDTKKEFQFFATPPDLARKLVALANLQPGHSVLEPSAGLGALLDIAAQEVPLRQLHYCELFPAHQAELKRKGYRNFLAADFLELDPTAHQFDRIIANPPFSKGQDVDHTRHAFRMLKPGGTMAVITSPSWTFRDDSRNTQFRDWIDSNGFYTEELPAGTFAESGTDVRTMLLVIHKPKYDAEPEPEPAEPTPEPEPKTKTKRALILTADEYTPSLL
jgi:type I restriction-modification system DNA methylase subunit